MQVNPVRFYRSQLETIVWDKKNNRVLADFTQGHFTTTDSRTIKKLRDMGYPEIGIEDEQPPDIVVKRSVTEIKGDVPVMKSEYIPEKVMENKMKGLTHEVGGPSAPNIRKKVPDSIPRRKKKSA